jgi:uncharacterized protein with beta-barrel porin domain
MRLSFFCGSFVMLPIILLGTSPTSYTVSLSTDSASSSGGATGDLRYTLNQILNYQAQGESAGAEGITIVFESGVTSIALSNYLPPINLFPTYDTITIGNGSSSETVTISGGSSYRPFFIAQGDVTLQNLTLTDGNAQGGSGGSGGGGGGGGGGGLGAGGAIFIDSATVTLDNVIFTSNNATAGLGASGYYGGGGGMGGQGNTTAGGGGGGVVGNGGNGSVLGGGGGGSFGAGANGSGLNAGGGGGSAIIGGNGGNGAASGATGGHVSGYVFGGGGGGNATGSSGTGGGTGGGAGVSKGGGGGGGYDGSNGSSHAGGMGGVGGGGGGAGGSGGTGGAGGHGGGGGGGCYQTGVTATGGNGGYGGGGGGGGVVSGASGGSGGFGGGGGGIIEGGNGGNGGFGGAGGCGEVSGGNGGFGAGGGGGGAGSGGSGGVGGVVGFASEVTTPSGGDGAGMGGAIFVNTGTIQFTGNCSTASGTVSNNSGNGIAIGTDLFVVTGGTLSFTPGTGNTITLAGTIGDDSVNSIPSGEAWTPGTGSGAILTMAGPGTLVLEGENTYAGGTTLSSGTLSIESEGNIGGSSAALTLGGGTLSTTGNVSTSGSISVTGNAEIATGDGFTTTLSGTVTGSNGNTLTLSGGTNSLSQVAVNGSDVFTIAGNLGGSSSLTKTGTGTLLFTGTSSYTGTITVSEGQCTVNGTMPGNVSAQSGTTINGHGTVQGILSVGSGANLRPGNSIGTITVGTLDLDPNAITNIEFDDITSSLVQVTGVANLAGTLNLIQDAGSYASSGSYEILSAGTLNGMFDQITGGLPGYSFQLKYLGNNVYLDYIFGSATTIATEGLTGNILKFANYLNESAPASSEYFELTILSGLALNNALNSASPARNAFGPFVTGQTLFSLSRIVNDYLGNQRFLKHNNATEISSAVFLPEMDNLYAYNSKRCFAPAHKPAHEPAPMTVWTSGFADFSHQAKESQNPAFNFISEGLLIGFDYEGISYNRMGCSLGYAHSQIYDQDHMGGANIPYYFGSLYGSFSLNQFYLQTAFWAVFHQIHGHRNIAYPGVDTKAKGTSNGWQIDPHIELGYDIKRSWSTIEPYAAFDWAVNWEGSFKEHGAGDLNMRQKSNTSSMLQSEAGVRFYQSICKSYGRFGCREGASYMNRVPFGTGKITTAIVGSSAFVTLQSFTKVQNLGAINIDFFAELGKKQDILVTLGYEGQFGSSYIFNEVLLNILKRF